MFEKLSGFIRFVLNYRSKVVVRAMFYISMICACCVIVHIGYLHSSKYQDFFEKSILWMFYGLFFANLIITVASILLSRRINVPHYSGLLVTLYFLLIVFARNSGVLFLDFLTKSEWI